MKNRQPSSKQAKTPEKHVKEQKTGSSCGNIAVVMTDQPCHFPCVTAHLDASMSLTTPGTTCDHISEDAPISKRLLQHDTLMTAKLTEVFGEMIAHQTDFLDGDDTFTRRSTLHRQGHSATILNARLIIRKASLPDGFLENLQRTEILFGQLLMNHGISVQMTDRKVYTVKDADQIRWGRQLQMLRADSGDLLATIEELLVPEAELLRIIP